MVIGVVLRVVAGCALALCWREIHFAG